MLNDYEDNFSQANYELLKQDDLSPDMIRQFTLLQYPGNTKSILIETSPGLNEFKVLRVEELTTDISEYFIGLE